MDDRVKLTRKVGGATEIRILETDLADIGKAGLYAELESRGIQTEEIGEPQYSPLRRTWVIPVRKRDEE